ncbi:MAG: histidine-type phosphatase [Candidatus Cryptobacteroides sp.]
MNRLLVTLAGLLLCISGFAQYDIDYYRNCPEKLYGIYYINNFDGTSDTKAPKGYKPFYISHYGRHGARFQDSEESYTKVIDVLAYADSLNALTNLGKSVLKRASAYYELCRGRRGDLTPLGFRQHREMAHRTYSRFKEVFNGCSEITACSSLSRRCIMSMEAFSLGLKEMDPSLDIYTEATRVKLNAVNPGDKENPEYERHETLPSPWNESYKEFCARLLNTEITDRIALRLFTPDFVSRGFDSIVFTDRLYNMVAGMGCLDCGIRIDDVFTIEELFVFWRRINEGFFEWSTLNRDTYKPILRDIINQANEDIASGNKIVRLRFGHDINLQSVLTMIGALDFAVIPESIDDLHLTWQCWNTPMAATLEFVFYRSKKNPEILFKVVLNGEEIPLSTLKPVSFPYYRWEDFTEAFEGL